MEYKGKLYGKANGVTFPLLNTTDDWDKMEARIKELEDENNALKQANGVEQRDSTCNLQNVNVRFPSKEKVIEEGERQIDVWLEGNTERELQHFRVGFRRSFEYVLRCLNAR